MIFYSNGKRIDYGGKMGFQDIIDFIKENEYGSPPLLTGDSSQYLLDDRRWKGHLTYISKNEFYEDKKEILIANKEKLKELNVTTSHIPHDTDAAKEILEIFGLYELDKSRALFLGIEKGEDYKKYMLEEDLLNENILQFVTDALEDKIPKVYKSQRPPIENEDLLVKSVVRDNFKDNVLEGTETVLLVVYSKESKKSKSFMPIFERAAKHLSSKNEGIKFFKYDYLENDVTEFEVNALPTVYLFKGDDKSNPILIASKIENSEVLNDEEEIFEAIAKHTQINFEIDQDAKIKKKVEKEMEEETKPKSENCDASGETCNKEPEELEDRPSKESSEPPQQEEVIEKFNTETPEKVEL